MDLSIRYTKFASLLMISQMEKLKKEKQILDHRSITLNIMPAVQRKEVEELKEALAKEQEEHRGKEMRLRLTVDVLALLILFSIS